MALTLKMLKTLTFLVAMKVLPSHQQSYGICHLSRSALARSDRAGVVKYPPAGEPPRDWQECHWDFRVKKNQVILMRVTEIQLSLWNRNLCRDYIVLPDNSVRCGYRPDRRSICYKRKATKCRQSACNLYRNWKRNPSLTFLSDEDIRKDSKFAIQYKVLDCEERNTKIMRHLPPNPPIQSSTTPTTTETNLTSAGTKPDALMWTLPVGIFILMALIIVVCCIQTKRKKARQKKMSICTITTCDGAKQQALPVERSSYLTQVTPLYKANKNANERNVPQQNDHLLWKNTRELSSNNRIEIPDISHRPVDSSDLQNPENASFEPYYESFHGLPCTSSGLIDSDMVNDYEEVKDEGAVKNLSLSNYEEPIKAIQPTYFMITG